MNKLIERLPQNLSRWCDNDRLAVIKALEAADRMAEIIEDILANCSLPPSPSITAAYRNLTQETPHATQY